MALSSGTRLGPYEILSPIGAGGMGEVYRARDTKLGREVAIKVLPEEFARDKGRLARFEREARLLAQLNHPNVATLYGLEQHDGQKFLVMELVEGETLAERIARGPIPLDEALPLFIEIAEGLEAAHDKATVHRDLKPANIKIGPDGKPKILDFGLAKAFVGEEATTDSSQSPTLTKGTALGAIMGTASYMSPEQARGKPVDRRTDIWAYGCCLFEALTGRRAFDGDTVSDIIGSVLRDEPDMRTLSPHPARLLERCLRKDAAERLRDIGDARLELCEPRDESQPSGRSTKVRAVVPWVLFVLATMAALVAKLEDRSVPQRVSRFVVALPPEARFPGDGPEQHVAFSPDGSRIAFTARDGNSRADSSLYVLERNRFTPTVIAGADGALNPFFSPDSQWIGFFAAGKLQKVSVDGGNPIVICDAARSPGASWGRDERIVFADRYSSGFFAVSASGGDPEPATALGDGEMGHRWPQHVDDGDSLLYSIRTERGTRIVVESLETGARTLVFDEGVGATQALYLASGQLLYDQSGVLLVSSFEIDGFESSGSPTSVAQGAHSFTGAGGLTYVAASLSGDIVFMPTSVTRTLSSIGILQGTGEWMTLEKPTRQYESLALDPDGRRLALAIVLEGGGSEIWLRDIARSSLSPLVQEGRSNDRPVWTPDGVEIVFSSGRSGRPPNLFFTSADGSRESEVLLTSAEPHTPWAWSPDGETLIFRHNAGELRRLDGDGTVQPLLTSVSASYGADISPDGRWIAYVSEESGRNEVYVTSFPAVGARLPISTEGGDLPVWSPNGTGLYFRGGSGLMRVGMVLKEELAIGLPETVVKTELIDYDVGPNEEIVAIVPEGARGWNRLHIVHNWFEELERLVPTNN